MSHAAPEIGTSLQWSRLFIDVLQISSYESYCNRTPRRCGWWTIFLCTPTLYNSLISIGLPTLQRSWKGGKLISPCPPARLWTESCPPCIFNNTHRILFIFTHLIKKPQKVCRARFFFFFFLHWTIGHLPVMMTRYYGCCFRRHACLNMFLLNTSIIQDKTHGWPSTQPGSLHTALQRKYTQPCSLFSRGTAVWTMGARLCEQWGTAVCKCPAV